MPNRFDRKLIDILAAHKGATDSLHATTLLADPVSLPNKLRKVVPDGYLEALDKSKKPS